MRPVRALLFISAVRVLLVGGSRKKRELISALAAGHHAVDHVRSIERALKLLGKYDLHVVDYAVGAAAAQRLLRAAFARGLETPVVFDTSDAVERSRLVTSLREAGEGFAARLADAVNNPLAALLANLTFIEERVLCDAALESTLADAREAARRIGEVVKALQARR